jgi:uncharacterized protein (UPF0261 family)
MTTIVLLGTLDTKGEEYEYVRERLVELGCEVIVVDAGVMGQARYAVDVSPDEVALAAGASRAALAEAGDRGRAVAAMAEGAREIITRLHADGRLDGILAFGGSGGASLAAPAMRALPVGVARLLVSTMAAGDTRPYIGGSDIAMLYPVVDIAGLNRVSARILANAAGAIAGMARAAASEVPGIAERPLVGATMNGSTTPCVTAARRVLEGLGFELLVFHTTGTGGRSMEDLARAGFFVGVLDAVTTELADEVAGGMLSAGPDRLDGAGAAGIPQVVSLGALDMINFGPPETVPERFRERTLYRHNPTVTLMRTNVSEGAEIGRLMARKLNAARGPVSVFIPRGGVSTIDAPSKPFHDPAADEALAAALVSGLEPRVEVVEMAAHINDPSFGQAMAQRLAQLIAVVASAARPAAGAL